MVTVTNYGNSKVLYYYSAIMLKANTAPNSNINYVQEAQEECQKKKTQGGRVNTGWAKEDRQKNN